LIVLLYDPSQPELKFWIGSENPVTIRVDSLRMRVWRDGCEADAGKKIQDHFGAYCGSGTSLAFGLLGLGFSKMSSQLIECSASQRCFKVSQYDDADAGSLVHECDLRRMT
jgi:hypothetical protein